MMKRIFLISCFGLLSHLIFCQISDYAESPYGIKSSIEINLCTNEYELWYYAFSDFHTLKGKISYSTGVYKCNIFYIKEIKFKRIDRYRLLVLNSNPFFKKDKILYCQLIKDCNNNRIEDGMFWENGLREFNWNVYTKIGVITTKYKKGRKIKVYFNTYEEIDEISSKLPKM